MACIFAGSFVVSTRPALPAAVARGLLRVTPCRRGFVVTVWLRNLRDRRRQYTPAVVVDAKPRKGRTPLMPSLPERRLALAFVALQESLDEDICMTFESRLH